MSFKSLQTMTQGDGTNGDLMILVYQDFGSVLAGTELALAEAVLSKYWSDLAGA